MDDPSTGGGLFALNEKVLVPHTDKYYEAKVTRAERRNGLWHYFLHYTGWNKKYDEWVEETGLAKCAQAPGDAAGGTMAAKKGAKGGAGVPAALVSHVGRKRPLPDSVATTSGAVTPSTAGAAAPGGVLPCLPLNLVMPPILKKALLDDHDAVVEERRLVPLPRAPTVKQLLDMYVREAYETHKSAEAEEEAANGLRAYFDKALHVALLYPSERPQEVLALVDGRVASSVYGAEHLLRLLVKLPELLASAASQVTEEQTHQMAALVMDLMQWVALKAPALLLQKDQYLLLGT